MRSWFPLAAESTALAALAVTEAVILEEEERFLSQRRSIRARPRQRRTVQEVFDGLGQIYFRRAYRMEYSTFWLLHDKLKKSMGENLYRIRGRQLPSDGVGDLGNRG